MITQNTYNDILNDKPLVVEFDGKVIPWGEFSFRTDVIHLLPGSFNPLHAGHLNIWEYIRGIKAFEISINRINKQPYSLENLNKILNQFQWKYPVLITNKPLFEDKNVLLYDSFYTCELIETRTIVSHIGYDTYLRIKNTTPTVFQNPKYRFRIYPRIINGKINSFHMNYEDKNCESGYHQIDSRILTLASSNLERII